MEGKLDNLDHKNKENKSTIENSKKYEPSSDDNDTRNKRSRRTA